MIGRYKLFLELRRQAPNVFSVPPIDVDFIWHTHMSMNLQYYDMCVTHFGYLVSHKTVSPDDKPASLTRDSGFHDTQKAWAELFPGTALLLHNVCCGYQDNCPCVELSLLRVPAVSWIPVALSSH